MSDFIAEQDRVLLERHGLASYEALWALTLEAVDEPNTERGGWSSVYRLDLGEQAFYLKRQSNHLTRNVLRPFGEPTFAREFRNIQRFKRLGIPSLEAAFFAKRRINTERQAVLVTRALDGWSDLQGLLESWPRLPGVERGEIVTACGKLMRNLHAAGQLHGCFYPKHVFLQRSSGGYAARLIDLEKTRPLLLGERDRLKDLDPFLRRTCAWSDDEVRHFLTAYLPIGTDIERWRLRLDARRRSKEFAVGAC
ncbi:lipopolysaccharide kinase InaA family protein [Pseudomonas borbori]